MEAISTERRTQNTEQARRALDNFHPKQLSAFLVQRASCIQGGCLDCRLYRFVVGGWVMLGEVIYQVQCARSPVGIEIDLVRCDTKASGCAGPMVFSAFDKILLVSSACDVVLSKCISVRGWRWASLVNICCIKMDFFVLMNKAPNSASNADGVAAVRRYSDLVWTHIMYEWWPLAIHW